MQYRKPLVSYNTIRMNQTLDKYQEKPSSIDGSKPANTLPECQSQQSTQSQTQSSETSEVCHQTDAIRKKQEEEQ